MPDLRKVTRSSGGEGSDGLSSKPGWNDDVRVKHPEKYRSIFSLEAETMKGDGRMRPSDGVKGRAPHLSLSTTKSAAAAYGSLPFVLESPRAESPRKSPTSATPVTPSCLGGKGNGIEKLEHAKTVYKQKLTDFNFIIDNEYIANTTGTLMIDNTQGKATKHIQSKSKKKLKNKAVQPSVVKEHLTDPTQSSTDGIKLELPFKPQKEKSVTAEQQLLNTDNADEDSKRSVRSEANVTLPKAVLHPAVVASMAERGVKPPNSLPVKPPSSPPTESRDSLPVSVSLFESGTVVTPRLSRKTLSPPSSPTREHVPSKPKAKEAEEKPKVEAQSKVQEKLDPEKHNLFGVSPKLTRKQMKDPKKAKGIFGGSGPIA